MGEWIDKLIDETVARGRRKPSDFRGCTASETSDLERQLGIRLPKTFRIYLSRMGRSAGEFLLGSDVRFGCLHLLTAEARDCARGISIEMPEDGFAFFAHQGYDYLYFRLDGSDDPIVYRFHEDPLVLRFHEAKGGSVAVFRRFSDYVHWMLSGSETLPISLE